MISLLFYLLLLITIGFSFQLLIFGSSKTLFSERLAQTLGLGTCLLGFGLFFLSLAGYRPTFLPLATGGVIAIAMIAVQRRRCQTCREFNPVGFSKPSNIAFALGSSVFAGVALGYICWDSFAHTVYGWDAYLNWGLKARVVTVEPLAKTDFFQRPAFMSLHPALSPPCPVYNGPVLTGLAVKLMT